LGERECSLQRRHQKIIEESPSSIVTSEDRAVLSEWTKKIVQQIKYEGAGTIEYLRSPSGKYYFLEINARLQVEHPVTEYITKIDIVQKQIDIANKKHLTIDEDALHFVGHAIESRVYAEDPETFIPSPGTISELFLPETNENVRIDHALQKNGTVPPYYDPLLCKVIVWEKSRENALQLLIQTLQEIRIEGIQTTIPLSLRLLKNEDFVHGVYDVTTVDRLLNL
jgi:acetyl-CoA carboxylase biotin carboxylase subunit